MLSSLGFLLKHLTVWSYLPKQNSKVLNNDHHLLFIYMYVCLRMHYIHITRLNTTTRTIYHACAIAWYIVHCATQNCILRYTQNPSNMRNNFFWSIKWNNCIWNKNRWSSEIYGNIVFIEQVIQCYKLVDQLKWSYFHIWSNEIVVFSHSIKWYHSFCHVEQMKQDSIKWNRILSSETEFYQVKQLHMWSIKWNEYVSNNWNRSHSIKWNDSDSIKWKFPSSFYFPKKRRKEKWSKKRESVVLTISSWSGNVE